MGRADTNCPIIYPTNGLRAAALGMEAGAFAVSAGRRAATSLARLWAGQGERQRAHDLLAPVHDWFTEGFATEDLVEAGRLLHALGEQRPPEAPGGRASPGNLGIAVGSEAAQPAVAWSERSTGFRVLAAGRSTSALPICPASTSSPLLRPSFCRRASQPS